MKKLLVLTILLTSFSDIFAFTTQGNWRWRKDNGSEVTATWIAAQNTAITISSTSETLRLRIELYNDAANPGGTLDGAFFESSSDNVNWDTIKAVVDKAQPFMLVGTSPNVTDLQPTTQQLTSPHYTIFMAGREIVSSTKLPAATVGTDGGTEYEYVFKPTTNIKSATTYFFRVDAATYIPANPLPSLTTATVLSVQLTNFTAKIEGKTAKIEWSTSSEQNNDKFEVERSNNLTDWKVISTIKGNGTTDEVHNYTTYDQSPFESLNYYRLKQYDLDGKVTVSAVKSLNFSSNQPAFVTVSPNPARDAVNFRINNAGANNVAVSLINTNGKIIHQEEIESVDAGKLYKLNMQQKPAPGIYILSLKSKTFNENIKIVIQ